MRYVNLESEYWKGTVRMNKKIVLSLILASNILLTTSAHAVEVNNNKAFPFFNKSQSEKKEDKVKEADKYIESGKVNVVKKDEYFKIALDENLTSGYLWTYKTNDKAIALIDERKIIIEPNVVGTPYKKVWKFEAKKKGTYKMVFSYARPWEKNVPPIKTVEYTIKVE